MPLEHLNITVSDAKASAAEVMKIFDWHIRWEGASMDDGYTVHVGDAQSYLAYYSPAHQLGNDLPERYTAPGGVNHVGVVVSNLAMTEERVVAAGYEPRSHYDYEPGKRFYFDGPDGIEFEVVSYA